METKIIQITAGKGPVECTWVVAQVFKYFLEDLKQNKINYIILDKISGIENGTIQSVYIQLEAKNIFEFLTKWIGQSNYRKLNKRKNWFIGLFEIKNIQSLKFNEDEIKYQTCRSQGSGGQNVNKVNSAVRAIHLPTNISIFAQDNRSQLENKKLAKERLIQKIKQMNIKQIQFQVQNKWENILNLERGNPIKTFKGSDFKFKKEEKKFKSKRNKLKKELKFELK